MYQQFFYLVTGISQIIASAAVIIFAVIYLLKQTSGRRRWRHSDQREEYEQDRYQIIQTVEQNRIKNLEHLVEIYHVIDTITPDNDESILIKKTITNWIQNLQEEINESKD